MDIIEPTFDRDGYPTEETLEIIEKWSDKDFAGLIVFIQKAWRYPERFSFIGDRVEQCWKDTNVWYVSTGGWSGNESIIDALHANYMFWACCWLSSRRGGHYEFSVKPNR